MRIAIYARVSTDDKGQDPENQLRELRAWCANAGHTIAHEYIDHESGRKGAKGRKQFAQLFEDAHKRKFDCVLFWALDRFTREGMAATVMYLQRLAGHGVSFHSYTEAHLSTDNELVGNILLAVMSSLAKVESQKIGERTRAGMARARAQGKRIGRPALDPALRQKIAKQLGAGLSAYAVAKQLGIDAHTVAKYSPFDDAVAAWRRENVSVGLRYPPIWKKRLERLWSSRDEQRPPTSTHSRRPKTVASGHVAAVPPSSVMNLRRITRSPQFAILSPKTVKNFSQVTSQVTPCAFRRRPEGCPEYRTMGHL